MSAPTREAMALNRAVAAQIRSVLAVRRMRQSALAARMGVTEVWLSRRLREVQALSLDDVERICEALRVKPADLIASAINGAWQTTQEAFTVPDRPRDNRPVGRAGTTGPGNRPDDGRPRRMNNRPAVVAPSRAA
jgi:DNA-binding Xre family transcriptional regulator